MCRALVILMSLAALAMSGSNVRVPRETIDQCLDGKLSTGASVVHSSSIAPRWSTYDAPEPGTVVLVATENDVAVTVQCANLLGVQFLAQAGGVGWADEFHINSGDVTIDLRGLNSISFSSDLTSVTVGGGTIISELVSASYANNAQVVTGNCNCVGVTGALLGAGYGHLMGKWGFMVDNVLSMNVVNACGNLETVTSASDPDLWYALRGAGPNFGIVTSLVYKAHPVPQAQSLAWTGPLIFQSSQIADLIAAIDQLTLNENMAIFLYYLTSGPPSYTPTVAALPFYYGGDEATAKAAFASIYAVGPIADETAVTPYNEWNAGGDSFCLFGNQRKPSYGAATATMDVNTWVELFEEYSAFISKYGGATVGNSTILMEAYSLAYAESLGVSSSAYAWRSTNRFNHAVLMVYSSPSLDSAVNALGSQWRNQLRASSGLSGNPVYVLPRSKSVALNLLLTVASIDISTLHTAMIPCHRFMEVVCRAYNHSRHSATRPVASTSGSTSPASHKLCTYLCTCSLVLYISLVL